MKDEKLKKILDDHAAWLENPKTGNRANFSNEKWCGVDLPGANLQKAFLGVDYDLQSKEHPFEEIYYYFEATRAELQGANFSEANLQDADLRGANLAGADFSGADLRGANLSPSAPIYREEDDFVYAYNPEYDSYKTNLSGADLSNADLRGANLAGANLSRADLSNANLRGANLQKANLTDAILKGADFSGADLTDADLTGADLTDANLRGAKGYEPSDGTKNSQRVEISD